MLCVFRLVFLSVDFRFYVGVAGVRERARPGGVFTGDPIRSDQAACVVSLLYIFPRPAPLPSRERLLNMRFRGFVWLFGHPPVR